MDMQPDDTMRRALFDRAGARCECRLTLCNHKGRCRQELRWDDYTRSWDVLHMHLSDDPDDLDNWLVLCSVCLRLWPSDFNGSDQQSPPLNSQTIR
jgi:hypothetical protein